MFYFSRRPAAKKIGSIFLGTGQLLMFLFCFTVPPRPASAQTIELPQTPYAVPPPDPGADDATVNSDLERKRDMRSYREKNILPPPPSPELKRAKALLDETLKPRPQQFMSSLYLVIPYLTTTGERKKYTAEPTVHASMAWNLAETKNNSDSSTWVGFKLMPFAGTGIQQGTPGRYGFLYFGPMVALGSFDPPLRSVGRSALEDVVTGDIDRLVRSGYLLSASVVAQSRWSEIDPGADPPDGDFQSRGVAFDAPGVSVQADYVQILFGGWSVHYVVGALAGTGKTFIWLGAGTGGIY